MYPPMMELIVNTKKTSNGFILPSSNAETVNSVGIGIKLENIPLKNNPHNPNFTNTELCNAEPVNLCNIVAF